MFLAILETIGGLILAAILGPMFIAADSIILAIICFVGGFALLTSGIPYILGVMHGKRKIARGERSGRSSSGRSYSSYSDDDDDDSDYGSSSSSALKRPDDNVGFMIAREIESRLPAVTPSTNFSCSVYSDGSAYLRGAIVLWHSSDAERVSSAIQSGFNSALRQAASKGYDVECISMDASGVSLEAAD